MFLLPGCLPRTCLGSSPQLPIQLSPPAEIACCKRLDCLRHMSRLLSPPDEAACTTCRSSFCRLLKLPTLPARAACITCQSCPRRLPGCCAESHGPSPRASLEAVGSGHKLVVAGGLGLSSEHPLGQAPLPPGTADAVERAKVRQFFVRARSFTAGRCSAARGLLEVRWCRGGGYMHINVLVCTYMNVY